ncbi:MAG TPA: acetate/propionate family kinase [Puia sp.]|nr:acetate/propionate family kinase [Puia sp.]
MKSAKSCILTINGGSSSIKFALFEIAAAPAQLYKGELERIGTKNAALHFTETNTGQKRSVNINISNQDDAANFLVTWLEKQDWFASVGAIGHRIVHGMGHVQPERVTPDLLGELKKISSYDPEHLPLEIKLIECFRERYPGMAQIACFDTSFHAFMPQVARLLPIPRRFYAMGIRRYGFHGLSYSYLLEEFGRMTGNKAAQGRLILAHLGNGASLAAVKDGKSMDTSMGFTPASGLPMGTRSGDLDPGVTGYLMETEKLSLQQFNHLIHHESGLLGLSETSSDMQDLLKSMDTDTRAAEAVELFCYQTKKWIGSFSAVLGGLDNLVFSGGIGENAPEIRARICRGLQFLGIELDQTRNLKNETIISTDSGKTTVRVIHTNEELMIARLVSADLKHPIKN